MTPVDWKSQGGPGGDVNAAVTRGGAVEAGGLAGIGDVQRAVDGERLIEVNLAPVDLHGRAGVNLAALVTETGTVELRTVRVCPVVRWRMGTVPSGRMALSVMVVPSGANPLAPCRSAQVKLVLPREAPEKLAAPALAEKRLALLRSALPRLAEVSVAELSVV